MSVKLVHILTEPETRREMESIASLSPLSGFGIDYIQQVNKRYSGEEWKSVPAISQSQFTNHGPGHYGAFQSFKKAILENFTSDIDALVLCECDCVLTVAHSEFADILSRAIEFSNAKDLCYVSLGSRYVKGVLQSNEAEYDEHFPEFYVTNKIILAHCVFIPQRYRDVVLDNLEKFSWDSPDLWFNESFWRSGFKRFGIVKERLARQHEGISLIDNVWKESQ